MANAVPEETMTCSAKVFGYDRHYTAHKLLDGKAKQVPDKTDLWCFHDCHPFDWRPVVDGEVYCSWACRKANLCESQSYHNQQALQNLPTKARHQSGLQGEIKRAPPRRALAVFGGPLSIADFRAYADKPRHEVSIVQEYLITEAVLYEFKHPQSDKEGFKQVFEGHVSGGRGERHVTAGCSNTPQNLYEQLDDDIRNGVDGLAPPRVLPPRSNLQRMMTRKKPCVRLAQQDAGGATNANE